MASRTTTASPAATVSSTATSTFTTVPCMGVRTSPFPPAPEPPPLPEFRRGRRAGRWSATGAVAPGGIHSFTV